MPVRTIGTRTTFERDVPVVTSDGTTLRANVFLPRDATRVPVIVSMTPYAKDAMTDPVEIVMRLAGVRFGRLARSRWTSFEAPDPIFWTAAGYAVVQADVRGMHRSDGNAGVFTDRDARDFFDTIEWAARAPWSSGAVGLLGVSYLAMSQWRVAALRPPSLRAIVPWEGATDLLREFAFQDGVLETGFIDTWWRMRMSRGHNRRFPMAEHFLRDREAHPFDDAYWAAKRPDLEAIGVPALVCASWSDQGLHTRGSFEGFERIGSAEKWLYTHGRRKWETFYSRDARETQRRFLDRYLKGEDNGWERTPRVRLDVRHTRRRSVVRSEEAWPLPNVRYRPLWLAAADGTLVDDAPQTMSSASYLARGKGERATFVYRFLNDTELTGTMALRLWLSASEGEDIDVFAVVRKRDARGRDVPFYGYNGFARDGVAKGWLRISHRELDDARTRPGRPFHTHARALPVRPGDIVAADVEILASSTHFQAGSSLVLEIGGHDAQPYPAFRHGRSPNRGRHTLYSGSVFDAHLLVPHVVAASVG